MPGLRELLDDDRIDMHAVTSHLDGLGSAERVAEIRSLRRGHQARLFAAAEAHMPIDLEHFVSSNHGDMQEVVHRGKNSLPAFNHFAKVFVRPASPERQELWGYNRAGSFVETVVGPGYFVAYRSAVQGEVLVDYLRVPPERPVDWPEILPNSARFSRFVYNGTKDILRGVSEHVTVGRATRDGRPMSAWFVLCLDAEAGSGE